MTATAMFMTMSLPMTNCRPSASDRDGRPRAHLVPPTARRRATMDLEPWMGKPPRHSGGVDPCSPRGALGHRDLRLDSIGQNGGGFPTDLLTPGDGCGRTRRPRHLHRTSEGAHQRPMEPLG